jgi:hypothetical protein
MGVDLNSSRVVRHMEEFSSQQKAALGALVGADRFSTGRSTGTTS